MADNLFRLGITTMYATDKKVAGFNDPNLHQVAVFAHSNENTLANPANIIQAYGRNRGLNPLKVPTFFLVTQKKVKCLFGVDELNKEDYQKDYDKSLTKFKKTYIKRIGQELGEEILIWIETNKDVFHEVDDEKLAEAVIEHCYDVLEKVNQANSYQYNLTQKDYKKVLGFAINHLKKEQKNLKEGTTLSFLVRVIALLMNSGAKIWHKLIAFNAKRKTRKLEKQFKDIDNEDSRRAKLHFKITNIPVTTIWKHDLARNLVLMNIVNEMKPMHEIRDKYYSALFLKPLDVLAKENKKKIKENYPDLKAIIEGVFSYIALSTVDQKEKYLLQAYKAVSENNLDEISELYRVLKSLDMNENHPQKEIHLKRLKRMLATIGTPEDQIPHDFQDVISLIKNDNNIENNTAVKINQNSRGLVHLKPNSYDALDYVKRIKQQIVADIKQLVLPLISDPAYKDMLRFIQADFTLNDLYTATNSESRGNQIQEFIDQVLHHSHEDAFYEKYFLPKNEELLEGNIDPTKLPIITVNTAIEMLFLVIKESNLRFYKINDRGEVTNPESQDKRFFRFVDASNPITRMAVDDYDIRLDTAEKLNQPQSLYIDLEDNVVKKIRQVNAEGKSVDLTGDFQPLVGLKLSDKLDGVFGSIKSHLSHADLEEFDNVVTHSIQVAPEQEGPQKKTWRQRLGLPSKVKYGETLFSPALNDQKTESGKSWRQVFGLNSLKTALPTINRINYIVKGKEYKKAVEVSTKVLSEIKKNKRNIKTSDSLLIHASLFNQVLRKETKARQKPCSEALNGQESRVEKMRASFHTAKEEYYSHKISDKTMGQLINQVLDYLHSRAILRENDNNLEIVSLKSQLFFNDGLTSDKANLALKLYKKLSKNKSENNYHHILRLVENYINENNKIMEKHGKCSGSGKFSKILNNMKECLIENRSELEQQIFIER